MIQRWPFILLTGCLVKDLPNSPSGLDTAVTGDTGDYSGLGGPEPCVPPDYAEHSFASEVIDFLPGAGAGHGEEGFPEIVLGPPLGAGSAAGSVDVLSLGEGGSIVLGFETLIEDLPGPDFIVFENPFIGWTEPAEVFVSIDGEEWVGWTCDVDTGVGCAGINPVLSHPNNCIDATDPNVAGGDSFDLSELGVNEARYLKIVDAAHSGPGGFDLDAVSIARHSLLR